MPRAASKKKKKVAARPKAKPAAARKKPSAPKVQRTPRAGLQEASAVSNYAIGNRVSHPQFGDGVVNAIDGEKLTIKFADGRTKQILDYYVKHQSK